MLCAGDESEVRCVQVRVRCAGECAVCRCIDARRNRTGNASRKLPEGRTGHVFR